MASRNGAHPASTERNADIEHKGKPQKVADETSNDRKETQHTVRKLPARRFSVSCTLFAILASLTAVSCSSTAEPATGPNQKAFEINETTTTAEAATTTVTPTTTIGVDEWCAHAERLAQTIMPTEFREVIELVERISIDSLNSAPEEIRTTVETNAQYFQQIIQEAERVNYIEADFNSAIFAEQAAGKEEVDTILDQYTLLECGIPYGY